MIASNHSLISALYFVAFHKARKFQRARWKMKRHTAWNSGEIAATHFIMDVMFSTTCNNSSAMKVIHFT